MKDYEKTSSDEDDESEHGMQYGDWLGASPLRRGSTETPKDHSYNAKRNLLLKKITEEQIDEQRCGDRSRTTADQQGRESSMVDVDREIQILNRQDLRDTIPPISLNPTIEEVARGLEGFGFQFIKDIKEGSHNKSASTAGQAGFNFSVGQAEAPLEAGHELGRFGPNKTALVNGLEIITETVYNEAAVGDQARDAVRMGQAGVSLIVGKIWARQAQAMLQSDFPISKLKDAKAGGSPEASLTCFSPPLSRDLTSLMADGYSAKPTDKKPETHLPIQ